MNRTLLTAGLVLCIAGTVIAQDQPKADKPTEAPAEKAVKKPKSAAPTLKAGDKAPALQVEKWVKGEPVTGFENGKAYIVEFWATWCGPCIASMPHLSEIQKEFGGKGLTVIGLTSEDPNNSLEDVQEMVKEKGDGMGYTVAWDSGRKTNDAYMKAAKQNGIPTSFVVDKAGTIAWIGHPMYLDMVVEPVLAGTWDTEKGPQKIKDVQDKVGKIYREARSNPEAALKAFEDLEATAPKMAHGMSDLKMNLLFQAGEYDKAYTLARPAVDDAIKAKNAMALNQIAWGIVDPKGNVEKKDLDLALKAATAADEITGHKDAAILDTVARVHWLKGDKNKALEIQQKAVDAAEGPMADELEATLEEYKKEMGKN